jgi:hypothetical protein
MATPNGGPLGSVVPKLKSARISLTRAVSGARDAGPWTQNAADFRAGGAVTQSRDGSCVAACGEMLSGGARSEAELLKQLGEWSHVAELAKALNGGVEGPWLGGAVSCSLDQLLSGGTAAIELKVFRADAHLVVAQRVDSNSALVRDPALGASYVQRLSRLTKYWTLFAVYRPHVAKASLRNRRSA